MFEDIKINPLTHEQALSKVASYIDYRLNIIWHLGQIDAYSEFVSLLGNARNLGLRGNHLSLIKSKIFNLLKNKVDKNNFNYEKQELIDELFFHKNLIENDITSKLQEPQDDLNHFYTLEAFFPIRQRNLHVGTIAKTYNQAAFKIRLDYGEFHLQNPEDFKVLDCKFLELKQEEESRIITCRLLRGECPVYYKNNNSCVIPEYKEFKSGLKKELEKILIS